MTISSIDIIKLLFGSALMIVAGGFCAVTLHAKPLSFDGDWEYRKSSSDLVDTTAREQSYRLIFDKDLTKGAELSGSIRYSKEGSSNADDSTLFNPTLALDLRNDFFSVNLNGSDRVLETENQADLKTRFWNANFQSLFKNIPSIRLNYGQSTTEDDSNPKTRDSVTTNYGVNFSHNIPHFRALYNFRANESEDFVLDRESDLKSHLGAISYSQSFFDQRMSVSVSEQVSRSEFDSVAQTALGVPIFQPLAASSLSAAYAGNDDTPADSSLASSPQLIDSAYGQNVVEILQPAESANFGVDVSFNQVNRIDVVLADVLSPVVSSQLGWKAYVRNSIAALWTEIPIVSVDYIDDVLNGNPVTVVEVVLTDPSDVPLEVNSVKLVVESPGAPAISDLAYVSEVEPGLVTIGSGDEVKTSFETTKSNTTAGVSYRLTDSWSADYKFSHDLTESKGSADRTIRTHSISSTYFLGQVTSFSASYNLSTNIVKGLFDQSERTYALSAYSSPLETLDYSVGFTRIENFDGSDQVLTQDTLRFFGSAQIFPDLSSAVTQSVSRSESRIDDSQRDQAVTLLSLTARISPRLNIDTQYDYTYTTVDFVTGDSTKSIDREYSATVSYRPSDVLLIVTRGTHQVEVDETVLTANMSWRMTPNLHLNESVSYEISDADSSVYTTRLTWALGRAFSLDSRHTYQKFETGDRYDLFLGLSANF